MNTTGVARNEPSSAVLEVIGLCKSYRQGFLARRGAPAIVDINLTVHRGEIFALLGHNGAGKTTTMKAILGLIRPEAGRIAICGLDALQPKARAAVGFLPEAPYFHENLTAVELLDFHGKLIGLDRRTRRERTDNCLELVGMADERKRRLVACSKGQRQRIGLAQALLGEPQLLILDEPQSGLDPLGRREVRELLLAQKQRGVTILFSSHIVPDVEAVADRVAILSRGRVVEVKDLRLRPPAHTFHAWLGDPPPAVVDSWRSRRELMVRQAEADRWLIVVEGVSALGRLLSDCAQHGVGIHDLQAEKGGLEDEFLARLLECEHQPEAVSC